VDRLSDANVRALGLEREQLLKQRHWQRLVNKAKREQHTQTLLRQKLLRQKSPRQESPRWTWGFRRISRFWGALHQRQGVK
jgi:hypothetical protein